MNLGQICIIKMAMTEDKIEIVGIIKAIYVFEVR
jgi:hypothetical protein